MPYLRDECGACCYWWPDREFCGMQMHGLTCVKDTPPITGLLVPAAPKAKDTQVAGDHYKKLGVEPWDVVDTWPLAQRVGYYRGGALKYIMRMGHKDQDAQEIAKGKHYLEKLLEVLAEAS